jgi:hypothetical protein
MPHQLRGKQAGWLKRQRYLFDMKAPCKFSQARAAGMMIGRFFSRFYEENIRIYSLFIMRTLR